MDMGNLYYGGHEVLMVFDDVFIPWERVFMCKEYEFTGPLVEKFTAYHRQSYACKVGVGRRAHRRHPDHRRIQRHRQGLPRER